MLGLCLEIRVACAGCGGPVPVNALVPSVPCPSCHRPLDLREAWTSLLDDPIGELDKLADHEGRNSTIFGALGQVQLQYGRLPPRCEGCKTLLPEEAFTHAGRGWVPCVSCGRRLSLRAMPAELAAAAPGAVYVLGEDVDQIPSPGGGAPTPKASRPVVFTCPQCRAGLQIDGSSRTVDCQYCSSSVYLPDDLWQRFHPVSEVKRWFLCFDAARRAQAQAMTLFDWYSLADAVVDREGNVICAGEHAPTDHFAIWSMDRQLHTRWQRLDLALDDSDARLALAPGGEIMLWEPGKHSLLVLSPADGSTLAKVGGAEPEGSEVHQLDLADCKALTIDTDGTILAIIHDRLLRFGRDGVGVATWPPKSGLFGKREEKLRPIYRGGRNAIEVESKLLEYVGDRPTVLDDYAVIQVGWDGMLYAERSEFLARYDRAGEQLYKITLPVAGTDGRPGADAQGNAYVLGSGEGRKKIVRVAPDGDTAVIAQDRRDGGALGEEGTLLVAPDGTLWLLHYYQRVRILASDGRVLHMSDRCREDDAKDTEERRKKIADDRVVD